MSSSPHFTSHLEPGKPESEVKRGKDEHETCQLIEARSPGRVRHRSLGLYVGCRAINHTPRVARWGNEPNPGMIKWEKEREKEARHGGRG